MVGHTRCTLSQMLPAPIAGHRDPLPDDHIAEGTDEAAADELRQLDALGCLRENTVLIHGVGLSEADRRRVLEAGAGLVWCPSTNLYLLGRTGDVRNSPQQVALAIGTDSRLTADGDMLDELKAASATGQLSPEQIFRAVTIDAAKLLRLPDVGFCVLVHAQIF